MIKEQTKDEIQTILYEMTNMINQKMERPISTILLNLTLIFKEEKLDRKTVQRLGLIKMESVKIQRVLHKLKSISNPKLIDYLKEIKIIDLDNSIDRHGEYKCS